MTSPLTDNSAQPRPDHVVDEPAGLYVHIPFCISRCGYCDFNAYAGLDHLKPRYVEALMREADVVSTGWEGVRFASVFLGGGTPTTLDATDLAALLAHIADRFDLQSDAEITIEANPDTVDRGSLTAIRAAGFARLSMGAQSFDPSVLVALERLHRPEAARAALRAARAAGYDNVNLDLIYGAAGESLDSWVMTLREAISLQPEHVSAYALTIEPATPLGRAVASGGIAAPDPDSQAEMFEMACRMLADVGYHHYEVSNWAKPGYECMHNLGYWQRRPYAGIGAGAHGFRDRRRWWNLRPPEAYMEAVESGSSPIAGEETLAPSDSYLEEVFLRLRILEGIPESWAAPGSAEPLLANRLLTRLDGSLVPTERGMLLLNQIVLELTSDRPAG
jgi:putative oxygen-independent coproporphyrinogen III oxidase